MECKSKSQIGVKPTDNIGEKALGWKGDEVSYSGLHKRFVRHYGNAKDHSCTTCESTVKEGKRMEWANLSGEYKWEREDWTVMCAKCHRHYDRERKQYAYSS